MKTFLFFVDFETFYSTTYSLTKMSPAEYILNPLFEAICLGTASRTSAPILIDGPEIPYFVQKLKALQQTGFSIIMVSHNAQFDMSILSWVYDFHPDMILDTIAMSRTVMGPLVTSHSLDNLSRVLGLPAKGSLIKEVKGMTRADIIANNLWDREVEYCLHDTWLCREIFNILFKQVPADEIALHDIITRCTTEPLLRLDRELLYQHLNEVLAKKAQTLASVEQMGITKAHLMSNPKFADVLRSLGVDPPTKISPTTKEETYAFAQNDEDFTDLLEHPNVLVSTAVAARLEMKSTLEETRSQRFIKICDLFFPGLGDHMMPMPVVIGAAHTHRFGGAWDLNVQNLGRGSRLRDAIHVEDGYTLLVVDSRQIEARFTAWFCGQDDLVQAFREGRDVYAEFASEIFDRKVTKADVPERFVGKTGILQLGYACGWLKFQNTVRNQSRDTATPIELTDEQAATVVYKYRGKYRNIKMTWRELDYVLSEMHSLPVFGEGEGQVKKCVTFYKHMMLGPTGLRIHFPNLRYELNEDDGSGSWWFQDGKRLRRTYGASLLETIAQHCSRCIVMCAAVRLQPTMQGLGSRLVHTAHDELVYRVPTANIEQAKIWAELEMRRPPSWAPDLPLDVECGTGQRYGDCK